MRVASSLVVLLAGLALVSQSASESAEMKTRGNKVEVRQFEMACVPGKAGVRIRLTLATGRVVEYRVEDAAETETIARLGSMFVNGRARMFADVDDAVVLGVEVAGPFGYRAGQ